jgi:hypothetical protein
MRVATISSNLKGTCIRTLKDAASYLTAAWKHESSRRSRRHEAECSGRSDRERKSRDRDRRIEALEKRMEELGPQIARNILDQLRG